ncbi:hypothetical protein GQR36_24040 [Enterococcus termitis]
MTNPFENILQNAEEQTELNKQAHHVPNVRKGNANLQKIEQQPKKERFNFSLYKKDRESLDQLAINYGFIKPSGKQMLQSF